MPFCSQKTKNLNFAWTTKTKQQYECTTFLLLKCGAEVHVASKIYGGTKLHRIAGWK